jgi:predicted nuclease of predicted toxin-antitoxin system
LRFLVDANLSPRIAARLRLEGHDVEHVGDVDLLVAEDGPILAHAASTGRVILSADSDFATLLAVTGRSEPSLVLLRSADRLTPDQQADLIVANIDVVAADLQSGAVVTIGRGHMRVRPLPMGRRIETAEGLEEGVRDPGVKALPDTPE